MADKTDYTKMDNETLTASITANRDAQAAIFALDEPTVAQVDEVETLMASAEAMNAEKATRDAVAAEAGKRFAAAKATFASEDDKKDEDADKADESDDAAKGKKDKPFSADAEGDDDEGDEVEGDESGDDEGDESGDDEGDETEGEDGDAAEGEAITASVDHTKGLKVKAASTGSVAKRVGRKTNRSASRASQSASDVVITASAGVEGFETGQRIDGMEGVTKALFARTKGFPKHNPAAARAVRAANGNQRQIETKPMASIGIPAPASLTASLGNDYNAVRNAIKAQSGEALTAAGWCAPSQPIYSYIADYAVDGLITVPEVSAPRGGILLTTGPARSSQGAALDDFGFVQTEAQAEAGEEKSIEVIDCPEFEEHRLDAIGYGVTIPLLTQKAYPELITDALKFAGVLWAHKVNKRIIDDIVALSDLKDFNGYGPSFTDSLEALAILAHKERRKWNLGENAVIEVKVPQFAKEVYRADMSRRSAVAFDSVADAQIAKHFTDRRMAVEYVADWQELEGDDIILPGDFDVLLYPAGTVIKAIEDVVNLSAIYDAASLTVNEYMGVFFEQGIFVAKAGYGVSRVNVPVNTAGEMGALTLQGLGDAVANGSF